MTFNDTENDNNLNEKNDKGKQKIKNNNNNKKKKLDEDWLVKIYSCIDTNTNKEYTIKLVR